MLGVFANFNAEDLKAPAIRAAASIMKVTRIAIVSAGEVLQEAARSRLQEQNYKSIINQLNKLDASTFYMDSQE